jgi:D-cysteine desulfhydrase
MNLQQFPKVSLGFFPTPVVELPRLSRALGGPTIYMKRDDQTGLALGGNKTRKLEYLLGDAIAKGCDAIITAGAAQSNHCRQTAAAAAKLGIECHLVLGGTNPDESDGNLLLDRIFGCRIHWAGENRKGEDVPQLFEQLAAERRRPYIVPYGGSNELGALAFAAAANELHEQCGELSLTHIVFASSSGGTQAGLMLGRNMLEKSYQLVGIKIDKEDAEDSFAHKVLSLANRTAALIDFNHTFTERELILNPSYLGAGYGVIGELEREAILLTARTEGILLDPVYTGRAMGGMIDMIRTGEIGRGDKVLFWHTGGSPAIFAYAAELGSSHNAAWNPSPANT